MTSRMIRMVVLVVAALVAAPFALSGAAQADPFAGTWTLNVAKSKYDPGPVAKSGSVTFTTKGTTVTAAITGVSGTGQAVKFGYSGALDGKAIPLTGSPDGDMIALRRSARRPSRRHTR